MRLGSRGVDAGINRATRRGGNRNSAVPETDEPRER